MGAKIFPKALKYGPDRLSLKAMLPKSPNHPPVLVENYYRVYT